MSRLSIIAVCVMMTSVYGLTVVYIVHGLTVIYLQQNNRKKQCHHIIKLDKLSVNLFSAHFLYFNVWKEFFVGDS